MNRQARRRPSPFGRFVLLFAFGLAAVLAGCGPFVDTAGQYDHATEVAGPPGAAISEGFAAPCDGLTAIDIQVARYPTLASDTDHLVLNLAQVSPTGPRTIATADYDAASLQPNAWIRFAFTPLSTIHGHALVLTAHPSGAVTLWADGPVKDAGFQRFVGSEPATGALVTRMSCDVPPLMLARETLGRVTGDGWLWPVEAGLAVIPGVAVALWLSRAERDPLWLLGKGVSWSIILAPLLLAAVTPLRAGSAAGWILLGGGVLGVVVWWQGVAAALPRRLGRQCTASRKDRGPPISVGAATGGRPYPGLRQSLADPGVAPGKSAESTSAGTDTPILSTKVLAVPYKSISLEVLLLATIAFCGGAALRAVQARNLPLPLWVDSPQHSYVVGRILAEGGVPATYGPLVPPQVFDYHFGFQSIAAYGAWLTDAGPAAAVLVGGQVLSALFCFAVYALIRDFDGSPLAAAIGALLVALVTTYPTYYVTWGRYPELAGLAALPAAFASFRAVAAPTWRRRDFVAAALASIGIIFVHPRVAVFLVALLAAALLVRLTERATTLGGLSRVVLAGGMGLALGVPWLARLWIAHHASTISGSVIVPGAALDIPLELVLVGNDTFLIGLAAVGLLVAFFRRRNLAATLVLWCALVFLVANLNRLGLPINLWLNGNSVAIAVFLPVVIVVGFLGEELAALADAVSQPRLGRAGVALVVAALALSRWPGMLTLVNPCCSLLGPGDLAALAWTREHTPPAARFVVNDYQWQGDVWAGTDAGAWLPVLAEREATMPPLFYAVGPARQVRDIDAQARFFATTTDPAAIARVARCVGANYVFIGAKGGPLDPVRLVASGLYRVDYRAGGAWVLQLTDGGKMRETVASCLPTADEAGRL